MDIVKKIDEIREEKGWSYYKLSQKSGLSQQTFTKWKNGNTIPTVLALKQVCDAFELSLADFFSESKPQLNASNPIENNWHKLTQEEQQSIELIIKNYLKNKK